MISMGCTPFSTGLTQWERPVLYTTIPQKKNVKLRRRGRLPCLSSGEDSDNQRNVPKADLQKWKQLREAADLRMVDLRYNLIIACSTTYQFKCKLLTDVMHLILALITGKY
jgi:hypothetical protein